MLKSRGSPAKGEVTLSFTIVALVVIAAGMVLGSNRVIRDQTIKFFGLAAGEKVRLTDPLVIADRGDRYILSSAICFSGLTVNSNPGRYWVHTQKKSDGIYAGSSVQYIAPQQQAPYCNGDGVPWNFAMVIKKTDLSYLCRSGLLFTSSTFAANEPINLNGETLSSICQLPSATPIPTLTPSGCTFFPRMAVLFENQADKPTSFPPGIWGIINDRSFVHTGKLFDQLDAEDLQDLDNNGRFDISTTMTPNAKCCTNEFVKNPTDPGAQSRAYTVAPDKASVTQNSLAHVSLRYPTDRFEVVRRECDDGVGCVIDPQGPNNKINNLPIYCNASYEYRFYLKSRTPTLTPIPTVVPSITPIPTTPPIACTLRDTNHAERCRPKNVRAELQRDSRGNRSTHKVDVSWDRMTDSFCAFDVYQVDIIEPTAPNGKIVCQRADIPKDENGSEPRVSVGCDVKTNLEGTHRDSETAKRGNGNFLDGVTYTASVYLYERDISACISTNSTATFSRDPKPTTAPPPTSAPQPTTTTSCAPGKLDTQNKCDAACCGSKSDCPSGQECNISNGGCKSGNSCNPNTPTTPNTPPQLPTADKSAVFCSVETMKGVLREYLKTKGETLSESEIEKRAGYASCICMKESTGGNRMAKNNACQKAAGPEYSLGLFQLNIFATQKHCPNNLSGLDVYNRTTYKCNVVNPANLNACEQYLFTPANNYAEMMEKSGAMSNWRPWTTSCPNYCNIPRNYGGYSAYCFYDLNGDEFVNSVDYARVVRRYGYDESIIVEDVNQDKNVNALDLSIILEHLGNPISAEALE